MASIGSMVPVLPAPALAHTAMGLNPAARSSATARASASTSRRKCSSLGSRRMHSGRTPIILAARIWALWLWSLMYTVIRSGWPTASRAATKASRLAAEPPLVNSPPALSG